MGTCAAAHWVRPHQDQEPGGSSRQEIIPRSNPTDRSAPIRSACCHSINKPRLRPRPRRSLRSRLAPSSRTVSRVGPSPISLIASRTLLRHPFGKQYSRAFDKKPCRHPSSRHDTIRWQPDRLGRGGERHPHTRALDRVRSQGPRKGPAVHLPDLRATQEFPQPRQPAATPLPPVSRPPTYYCRPTPGGGVTTATSTPASGLAAIVRQDASPAPPREQLS
ncbi:hypothetical protein Rumeso_02570 [Rubellimicrobium mesophilum DSM 19309]|uniref:Uncharacterized protein n=1 Tax=Rubellimicrobium mesophilum DSM 19309 TaxID=442562 RepID=A0A017HNP2_9RHOB|nr:hypothetical protein Rumeso_02570 [Rubellimicrobium mesophilum DSM 19309]